MPLFLILNKNQMKKNLQKRLDKVNAKLILRLVLRISSQSLLIPLHLSGLHRLILKQIVAMVISQYHEKIARNYLINWLFAGYVIHSLLRKSLSDRLNAAKPHSGKHKEPNSLNCESNKLQVSFKLSMMKQSVFGSKPHIPNFI